MNDIAYLSGLVLTFAGLGTIYLSRFMLRDVQKESGEELQERIPHLSRIRQRYSLHRMITLIAAGAILFSLYLLDPDFWKAHILLLFAPLVIAFAMNDAVFALRTNVFPATRKHETNSFFYDGKGYYRSVAYWQIALSLLLFVLNCVVIFSEMFAGE